MMHLLLIRRHASSHALTHLCAVALLELAAQSHAFAFLQGSHKDHQYELREGQTITMDVKPEAGETQFDWMWQAVAICDYGLLFNYTVVCN